MDNADPLLVRARAEGARLAAAEREALVARADYHAAVRRLHLAGASFREIADALGLSHQRVQQIVSTAGGSWWRRTWRRRGLPADAALRALTTTPATLFGVSDRLGTIEANRLACLTITDGDLFARKTKVVETWVAGQRFEIEPEPIRDVVGDWRLTFDWPDDEGGERPGELLLNIKQNGKLTAKIRPAATLPASSSAARRPRVPRPAQQERIGA